jgi:hypothetical protein
MKKHLMYAFALAASLATGAAHAISVVYLDFTPTGMSVSGSGVEGIYSTTGSTVLPVEWSTSYATGYSLKDANTILNPDLTNLNDQVSTTTFLNELLKALGETSVATGVKTDGNFASIIVSTEYFSIKQGDAGGGQGQYTAYFRLTGSEPVTVNITGGTSHWTSYGDPVPLPGAVWLFGSALVGLVALNRRRRLAA